MIGLHMVYGKKRAGKTMYCVRYVWQTIATTERQIVSNMAPRYPGAEDYLKREWEFEGDLHSRLWIERDPEQLRYFYLMLGQGWKVPRVTKEEWSRGRRLDLTYAYRWAPWQGEEGKADDRPDIWDLPLSGLFERVRLGEIERVLVKKLPKVTYFLDEIQNVFPAQMGMGSDPALRFWLTQSSKLACDVICTTQEPEWIEKSFRDLADDWMFVKNWGRERRGIFRGPKRATWAKFTRLPKADHEKPFLNGTFSINPAGIGDTYDTSAGVGIEGGLDADKDDKVGGLHWSFIPPAVVLVCVLLYYGIGWVMAGTTRLVGGTVSKGLNGGAVKTNVSPAPAVPASTPAVPVRVPGPVRPGHLRPELARRAPAVVPDKKLNGILTLDGRAAAFFADGTVVGSFDRRFGGLLKNSWGRYAGVRVDGQEYWLDH